MCELQTLHCVIISLYVKWSGSSLTSLWILPTPGRFTLLPFPTNSSQTEPGTNSCTRKKQTGSVLVVAVDYPQHWGFLSVFCTSTLFILPCPFPSGAVSGRFPGLSLQCIRPLVSYLPNWFLPHYFPWPVITVLLRLVVWFTALPWCFIHACIQAPGTLSSCKAAVQPRSTASACSLLCQPQLPACLSAQPAPLQCLCWHVMHACTRLFVSWLL